MKDEENASSGRLTCKDETRSRMLPPPVYIKLFFHYGLDNKSDVAVLRVVIHVFKWEKRSFLAFPFPFEMLCLVDFTFKFLRGHKTVFFSFSLILPVS